MAEDPAVSLGTYTEPGSGRIITLHPIRSLLVNVSSIFDIEVAFKRQVLLAGRVDPGEYTVPVIIPSSIDDIDDEGWVFGITRVRS